MDITAFSTYLSRFHLPESEIEQQVSCMLAFERRLAKRGSTLETATIGEIRAYFKRLIKKDENGIDNLLPLLYYYEHSDRTDLNIYLSDVIHGGQEYEEILERVGKISGSDVAWRIERECPLPPLGTDPTLFPEYTGHLLRKLSSILPDADVLPAIYDTEKSYLPMLYEYKIALFQAAGSIDEYLLASAKLELLRMRVIQRGNTKWNDVYFSDEFLRRISQNQELLSGVRRGNRIYTTMHPAQPVKYIKAKTLEKKRYYACHEPNINAGFLTGIPDVSIVWCERCVSRIRMKYECLLGRSLTAELVESALLGDTACRIAVLLEPDAVTE